MYVLCDRKEEQKANPIALINALKTFFLRKAKAIKYLWISSDSSTSSVNDEVISSDESQQTTQSSETADASAEHSPVSNRPSASTLPDKATTDDVSITHHLQYSLPFCVKTFIRLAFNALN